jgi:hypothetical protein
MGTGMRLSRPRVLLRAALLVVGSGFMLVKAWDAWGAAADGGAQQLLLKRIAVVEALVGLLALAAAVVALLAALRPRRRSHTLRLGDLQPPREGRPPEPPA